MNDKVKIFMDTQSNRLEINMNEWLKEHRDIAIIDIKYSISSCGNSGGAVYYDYSALIHYTED